MNLTAEEIEVIKLMFSLMDVNGDLTLGVQEVHEFITNILSDPINEDTAQRYLHAMDMNQDGVVCFTDLLQCVSLLKIKYQSESSLDVSALILPPKESQRVYAYVGMGISTTLLAIALYRKRPQIASWKNASLLILFLYICRRVHRSIR